ncbi:PAS domain S-box protein [Acidobacteriota bacterium]
MNELDDLRERIFNLEKQVGEKDQIITSLKDAENRYRMIFDNANDGIILHELNGRIIDVNETMYKRLGFTKKQMLGMNLEHFVVPDHASLIEERTRKLEEDGFAIFQSGDRRKDGSVIPVEISARIVNFQGKRICQSVVRDVSYRKMAEDLVQSTREEKEVLLGVLRWRSRYCAWFHGRLLEYMSVLKDQLAISGLLQAVNSRIQTMVFIEDKIYRSLNFKVVGLAPVIQSLTAYLHSHCRVGIKNIRIEQHLDGMCLDIKRTILCSLLINELVSNGLLHAFSDDSGGKIEVRMQRDEQDYLLTVKDNGIGLPNGFELKKQDSMGMWVIRELADNLDGKLHVESHSGTEVSIRFTGQVLNEDR